MHVQSVMHRLSLDLSRDELEKATDFVLKYADAFSKSVCDIGRTKLVPYRINTGSNRQVRQQLRRHPQAHLEVIDQESIRCWTMTS
jgi:hypothetical protein